MIGFYSLPDLSNNFRGTEYDHSVLKGTTVPWALIEILGDGWVRGPAILQRSCTPNRAPRILPTKDKRRTGQTTSNNTQSAKVGGHSYEH